MSAKITIQQKQIHSLKLTPSLVQGFLLMQMNQQELLEYVNGVAENNPLLEIELPLNFESSNDFYLDLPQPLTLHDYLISQIDHQDDLLISLIYEIDENGYLRETNQELAKLYQTKQSEIQNRLEIIRLLDPAGIGARDLKDCLLLQAKRHYPENMLLKVVLENYLEQVASGNLHFISVKTKATIPECEQVIALIKTLDPKPGMQFNQKPTDYIIPDVEVLNNDGFLSCRYIRPFQITLQENLIKNLRRSTISKEQKSMIEGYKYEARQLVMNLKKRYENFQAITEFIIHQQQAFFLEQKPLKILRQSDIAQALQLHKSSISRILKNKYFLFQQHLFPLSNLLCKPATSQISKSQIQTILQEFFRSYPKHSDLAIQQLLQAQNVNLSRRAINKYRNQMRIGNSYQRRLP